MIQLHIFRRRDDGGRGDDRPGGGSLCEGSLEFLLLQRAEEEHIYPGLWQPVTGHIEAGETAADAALRELREETGLRPLEYGAVPHVAMFFSPDEDAVHLIPVFWCRVAGDARVRLSEEHQQYAWLSLADAGQRLVIPSHRTGLRLLADVVIPHADVFRAIVPPDAYI